ncbi:MAG: isocitrate/isopropylmalate family dehydrogenase, partial [Acidimicrobiales bacterium]
QPGRYDVIVTDNLFGDILTDLAGAIAGGIGFAASANLNPARTGPSLFEPVHGAAHDIARSGKANPLAAIRSAALMLDHLGDTDASERIAKAVTAYVAEHPSGAPYPSTIAIGDAIAERL